MPLARVAVELALAAPLNDLAERFKLPRRSARPPADPWRRVAHLVELDPGPGGGARVRLVLAPCGHELDRRRPAKRARCPVCGSPAFVRWLVGLRSV